MCIWRSSFTSPDSHLFYIHIPSFMHSYTFSPLSKKGSGKSHLRVLSKVNFCQIFGIFIGPYYARTLDLDPIEPNLKGISELKPKKNLTYISYLRKDICQSIIWLTFFNVLWCSFHERNWLRFRSYFLCSKHHFATKLGLHLLKWRFRNMHVSHHHHFL